jgi:aspartate/methionine/tyrosine aminotransferase
MVTVSKRAQYIRYAIRDVVVFAKEIEKQGRDILYLNIGDPVKYDFDTPNHIKNALIKAVQDGSNSYSSSEGILELREAICRREKKNSDIDIYPENVMVTNGISEGLQMLLGAFIETGDEVLLPDPTYPPYTAYMKFFGGKPVTYKTVEEEGWQPDIDNIRSQITDKTKGIVVINPNNPSGAMYDRKVLRQIVDVAAEHNLLIISDEIYDKIVYDGSFTSTSSVAKEVPVVGLNGFSKVYLMTGWRLGHVYFYDPESALVELRESMMKEARIRLCANTPVQNAAIAALDGPQDHIKEMVGKLRLRRDYVLKRIAEIEGISCSKPEGAFYFFPKVDAIGSKWKDDKEFVLDFLETESVLLVHGSGFGTTYGAGHFRGVFLPPIDVLKIAFDRLERFLS